KYGICSESVWTNSGRSGRGPTIDISPRSTLNSCGSSTKRSFRKRDAWVVLLRPDRTGSLLRVGTHRAEFVKSEGNAIFSYAILAVEDGSRRLAGTKTRNRRTI